MRTTFKWAVGEQLIPGDVSAALKADRGLGRKHPGVRNTAKVRPVKPEVLAAKLAAARPGWRR